MSRIRGKATTDHRPPGTVVGVDVSKALAEVSLYPFGDRFRVWDDKADEIEAAVLAEFAAVVKPTSTEPPT